VPPGVPHGAGPIASNQGLGGTVQLDLRREAAKFRVVDDDHLRRWCRGSRTDIRRPVPASPSASRKPGLDALVLARQPANAPANPTLSTGLIRTTSSGSSSSQPKHRASCLLRSMAGIASSIRSAARPKSPAAKRVADRLGTARRSARATRSPAGAAQERRRAARPQARVQDVGEELVDSDTTDGGSSSGTRKRFPAPSAASLALPPSWPVTASHSGPLSPVQDRGLQQEVLDMLGLALQDSSPGSRRWYRSSPAKPSMNAAVSSRPCIESAASCSAAIHPSVRPLQRCDIGCRQHQAHHLVEVRRGITGREAQIGGADLGRARHAQRNRASGNGGSVRLAITRCICEGRCSSRKAIPSCTSRASMTW